MGIAQIIDRYRSYILACETEGKNFRFTKNSEISPYALCFAVFGLQLINDKETLVENRNIWDEILRRNINDKLNKTNSNELLFDKPFMQLLAFTLSALTILDTLKENPLLDIVIPLLPKNIKTYLEEISALRGKPGSGNFAMFVAILLIHVNEFTDTDKSGDIEEWVELHLSNINEFGFWGNSKSMTHLQFQNGYHQYEIMEYLGIDKPSLKIAYRHVANLADRHGHFAPYPGGGGCYDYDAVFILTGTVSEIQEGYKKLLDITFNAISAEQNKDGGFCESLLVRPRSLKTGIKMLTHIKNANAAARLERIRYCLTLQRPKHNRIKTHWSLYSRSWSESNLWDSWFRMLTLARIDVALNKCQYNWGFINYPGIGYHHTLNQ